MGGKTNATRILERLGIRFEVRDYVVEEADLSAVTVAAKVGMAPEEVFKTLVARGETTGVLMAVIPASSELDLKALARASGDRRVELVPLKQVQPLTGYVRGGVTALGCKKTYPVFADETLEICDQVAVSAGIRGRQIVLAPADYLRATGATTAAITRDTG